MLAEGYGGFAAKGGKSVVAAMSGGVDSAVTALLLKEAGYDVATVTFRLHDGEKGSRSCCSPDTVLFARDTAHRMGLPHFTLDLKELFNRRGMQRPRQVPRRLLPRRQDRLPLRRYRPLRPCRRGTRWGNDVPARG